MKILITSKNGYIATNLFNFLKKNHPYFYIDKKSIRNGLIPSLKNYDVVIHTAGLVHKNEFTIPLSLYLKVNKDLTVELATAAKESGIKHFIFLSSMSVYGVNPNLYKPVIITKSTPCKPNTSYGISKFEAENEITQLSTSYFKVAIIRPPMVYGLNAPGNYNKLAELSKITPIFPLIENQRSALNIFNLCQLINLIITFKSTGLFFPQDKDYISTSELISEIAPKGKLIYFSKELGGFIKAIDIPIIRKTFGNLVYDKNLSDHFEEKYIIYPKKYQNKNNKKTNLSIDA